MRSSDIEVFLDSRFVFAAAKRINNKEERIKNKHGVRFADGFLKFIAKGDTAVFISYLFFLLFSFSRRGHL